MEIMPGGRCFSQVIQIQSMINELITLWSKANRALKMKVTDIHMKHSEKEVQKKQQKQPRHAKDINLSFVSE